MPTTPASLLRIDPDLEVGWEGEQVVHVQVAAQTWIAHAPALLAAAPSLRSAQLHRVSSKRAVALAASPQLAALTRLVIHSNVSSDPVSSKGAAALGRSPHVGRLRYLQLYQCKIGPHGVRDMLAPNLLTSLRELDLRHNVCEWKGVQAILAWPGCGALEKLDVRTIGLAEADVIRLAAATGLARLDTLAVGARDGTLAMIEALVRSPLPSLRRIVVLPVLPWPDPSAWSALVEEAAARGRSLEIVGYGSPAWDDAP